MFGLIPSGHPDLRRLPLHQFWPDGYHPLLNDYSTTVVFDRPATQVCQTWQLACQGDRAHVVVMQNLCRERLDGFLDDLRRSRVTDW